MEPGRKKSRKKSFPGPPEKGFQLEKSGIAPYIIMMCAENIKEKERDDD